MVTKTAILEFTASIPEVKFKTEREGQTGAARQYAHLPLKVLATKQSDRHALADFEGKNVKVTISLEQGELQI